MAKPAIFIICLASCVIGAFLQEQIISDSPYIASEQDPELGIDTEELQAIIEDGRENFVKDSKRSGEYLNSDEDASFNPVRKENPHLGSVFLYSDQIMRNLLKNQSPKSLTYGHSPFFFGLLKPLGRRPARQNSWEDHSVMHFGKRSIDNKGVEGSDGLSHVIQKRSPEEFLDHSVMHFGKKNYDDAWDSHQTMHFGKKEDPWSDHNIMHFGKRDDPWSDHNIMHFGKKEDPWSDHHTMHFGKRGDPWIDHNTMHFGKKADPWSDHHTMHFGKKADPWNDHNTMHFGKKEDPWSGHNTMHFGKRDDPWSDHNIMHFGKKADPWSDHQTMHFGKKADPWNDHHTMHFGKKSDPWNDHHTMHFGKKSDTKLKDVRQDDSKLSSENNLKEAEAKSNTQHIKNSISEEGMAKKLAEMSDRLSEKELKEKWEPQMTSQYDSVNKNGLRLKRSEHDANHFVKRSDTKNDAKRSIEDENDKLMAPKGAARHLKMISNKVGETISKNKEPPKHSLPSQSKTEIKNPANIHKRNALDQDPETNKRIPAEIDNLNSVLHFGKRFVEASPNDEETVIEGIDVQNLEHDQKEKDIKKRSVDEDIAKRYSDSWMDHNTMHFGKRTFPWEEHDMLHFGKRPALWEDHNIMHFGKKGDPWEDHNIMHFGKKFDPWDMHNTMHFGKRSSPWEMHETMHFGKRLSPWDMHDTMHFGKRLTPWDMHDTMHFGKKASPWEMHETMHFGKRPSPWDMHDTMHFGKRSSPWEMHDTMHFGKRPDPWDMHDTMHFGKRSVNPESLATILNLDVNEQDDDDMNESLMDFLPRNALQMQANDDDDSNLDDNHILPALRSLLAENLNNLEDNEKDDSLKFLSSSKMKGSPQKRYWAPFRGPKSIIYPHAWLASQLRRSIIPMSVARIPEAKMAEKKEEPMNSHMHFG